MSDRFKYATHHGYAVNVKDYGSGSYAAIEAARSSLTDEEIQAAYERAQLDFWEVYAPRAIEEFTFSRAFPVKSAGSYAYRTRFDEVYAEGRMGGWCVPHPQPETDDMYPGEIEDFERDFARLAAVFEAEANYCADELVAEYLAEAIDAKATEAHERAHWAARDVETR